MGKKIDWRPRIQIYVPEDIYQEFNRRVLDSVYGSKGKIYGMIIDEYYHKNKDDLEEAILRTMVEVMKRRKESQEGSTNGATK